ncbi:unnamed protein product [Toxocara canis]|uniref:Secreted protein n=1 Tax=Toxocara canis TaxID=6265 RepID=A0A183U4E0_TOXCA|nr:unnamed protein product [Toxocara canis]
MQTFRTGILGSTRLSLALVSFLGCVSIYMLRNDVSFAIVCMVNSTAADLQSSSSGGSASSTCKPQSNDSGSTGNKVTNFNHFLNNFISYIELFQSRKISLHFVQKIKMETNSTNISTLI